MSQTVQLTIHGHRYNVRSELDAQYLQELATLVDEKMHQVGGDATTADPLRIAVITALNLADEVHRLRLEAETATGRASTKVLEIERILDAALEDGRTRAVNE